MTRTPTDLDASSPGPQRRRPMIEVRGIAKAFGDAYALHDVSFEIAEGEIFGFIGPNGAGKTTTLRILATLFEPTTGDAWIDGLHVEADTEAVRHIVGYMPDSFGVYEGITVAEYLDFFASAFRLPAARRAAVVADVMALTDLGGLRDRMVSALSQGMKQRLCLAKTLIHDPKVLLLDEPASALDPRARIELRALLKELGRMGKTILISSHILTELSDLCTSVGIIEKGRMVECGSMDLIERRRRGATRVRVSLCEPRPDVDDVLRGLPDVTDVVSDHDRITFSFGGRPDEFWRVVKALVDREVPLVAIEQEARNLEDLFMELTKGDVQ